MGEGVGVGGLGGVHFLSVKIHHLKEGGREGGRVRKMADYKCFLGGRMAVSGLGGVELFGGRMDHLGREGGREGMRLDTCLTMHAS